MSLDVRVVAQAMLDDLRSNYLDVVLTPARHGGGCVRSVQGRNPEWYRKLCSAYTCARAKPRRHSLHDTAIRRQSVVDCLTKLAEGREAPQVYLLRLLPFLHAYAQATDNAVPEPSRALTHT